MSQGSHWTPQEPVPPLDVLDSATGAPGSCRGSPALTLIPGKHLQAQPDPVLASLAPNLGMWDQDKEGWAPSSLGRAAVWGLIWAVCSGPLGSRAILGEPHLLWAPVSSVAMITQDPLAKSWVFSSAATAPGVN